MTVRDRRSGRQTDGGLNPESMIETRERITPAVDELRLRAAGTAQSTMIFLIRGRPRLPCTGQENAGTTELRET